MAYQLLQGVKITPKGQYNLGRFGESMVDGEWPNSYAFGGWIYNASCDIGFSNQPSEIKINIVLEVTSTDQQKYAFFNIGDGDLKCDAGEGKLENLYDIDFNGVVFSDMILYDYNISIEPTAKVLSVTFKDYSLILDKIYIGLLKRQGNKHVYSATARLEFPVICPDCSLSGGSLTQSSYAERDLAYGSYVGINGEVYDNFKDINLRVFDNVIGQYVTVTNIYQRWEALFNAPSEEPYFDLNGGYLILGTEDATEERCGDLAPVNYNFNQLLASLRVRGLLFEGAFPHASKDADYFYKQNYMGTLREVMQQWCSDLGYDFYIQGKTFIGINLNRAIDIQNVVDIVDPTTEFGKAFSATSESAILSYRTSSSLANTFKQAVITANNRPRMSKTHTKAPKRYVGILPLHPIDFNRHNNRPMLRYDAFGNTFMDKVWTNNFEVPSYDRFNTLPELDGRTYGDIDSCIALTRFDAGLRDIYCQDLALYGMTNEIRTTAFRALGMFPLIELTDDNSPEAKSMCIEALVGGNAGGGDEISSLCLDKLYYRVYLGYFYPKFKEDVINWEQIAGDGMYKYGIVTRGLLTGYPYMPRDSLTDLSPKSGLYGSEGTSLLRTQHSVEPACVEYFTQRLAPFKDLILYSGLMTPSSEALPDIPAIPYRTGLFPQGLFYAELNNEWGTSQDEFQKHMSLSLGDPCVSEFQQAQEYADLTENIPRKFQDWRVDLFTPKADPDLSKIWHEAAIALENLPYQTIYDRTVTTYYDLHYRYNQTCSKLHILVLTDTRNHPNFNCSFTPRSTRFINTPMLQQYYDREREAIKRRIETKTPTICDITLLQEMCRNLLSGSFQSVGGGDPRFGCVQDEDKWNWLEEGFTFPHLTRANSRGLQVRLTKNPISNTPRDLIGRVFRTSDVNGDFYYSDLMEESIIQTPAQMVYTIVYPVSAVVNTAGITSSIPLPAEDPGTISSSITGLGGYYRGILTSSVELENRSPEINEIFGEPVNSQYNVAAGLKIINNVVDPDLQPQLDPYSMRFWSYMTVITGDAQILTTVSQYHDMVQQLNSYELTSPSKTVDLSLAGSPNNFGIFSALISPNSGLNKLSMSVTDNGVVTSLTFSDRPKVLPKQESILNKITPRMR